MSYRKILADLIAIDTHTARDTLECVEYIKRYLDRYGVDTTVIYNATKTRGTLFATIGQPNNAIVLSGHLDTVPACADVWDTNPFVLTERDGKFWGRGVCDMKGAVAVALSMVPHFIKNGQNIGLLFTHDEEGDGTGIGGALSSPPVMDYLNNTAGVIVMEPSKRQIITEHKNVGDVVLAVRGRPAHSSDPAMGVDAIRYLCDAMNLFYAMLDEHREENVSFDVPYSTGIISGISGGNAVNVVPGAAAMDISVRFMTDAARDAFIRTYCDKIMEIQQKNPDVGFDIRVKAGMPALNKTNSTYFDRLPFPGGVNVSYCTEAGHFYKHNIPAIIYGPGDIAQAHTDNEFIAVSALDDFVNDMIVIGDLSKGNEI